MYVHVYVCVGGHKQKERRRKLNLVEGKCF